MNITYLGKTRFLLYFHNITTKVITKVATRTMIQVIVRPIASPMFSLLPISSVVSVPSVVIDDTGEY